VGAVEEGAGNACAPYRLTERMRLMVSKVELVFAVLSKEGGTTGMAERLQWGPYHLLIREAIADITQRIEQMDGQPSVEDAQTPTEMYAAGEFQALQDVQVLLSTWEVKKKQSPTEALGALIAVVGGLSERQQEFARGYGSISSEVFQALLQVLMRVGFPQEKR
jgi:hypothetical protein